MPESAFKIFLIFLKLGLYSFGGPIAHLGYFRNEFVIRKKWITDGDFSELVALCQFLPGPASSQTGIGIGFIKAGYKGAFAAWLGFTLPSALIMTALAIGTTKIELQNYSGLIKGLTLAGCAVVIHACYGMLRQLCPDTIRKFLAIAMAILFLVMNNVATQFLIVLISAGFGLCFLKNKVVNNTETKLNLNLSPQMGYNWFIGFSILSSAAVLLYYFSNSNLLNFYIHLYGVGSLVFGGGHIVLPMLQNFAVNNHIISNDLFFSGYGFAQALPGPLFTFSAYLGSAIKSEFNPLILGLSACIVIFLPSFFLLFSTLPFWYRIKQSPNVIHLIAGINAGVVGLLIAAIYNPLLTNEINTLKDILLLFFGLILVFSNKVNSFITVLCSALLGFIFF